MSKDIKTMDLTSVVKLYNGGNRNDEVWERLIVLTGGLACVKTDAPLNAAAVTDALKFARSTGRGPVGHVTVAALRQKSETVRYEASPLTGEALYRGQDGDGNDWSPISQDDRCAIILARGTGTIGGKSAEDLIYAFTSSPPIPPAPRMRSAWAALDKDSEEAAEIRRQLYVRPKPQTQSAVHAPTAAELRKELDRHLELKAYHEAVALDGPRCGATDLGRGCPSKRGPCTPRGTVGLCGKVCL